MKVIHGFWTPTDTQAFIQSGRFSIWVESDETRRVSKKTLHPYHLTEKPCLDFITQELSLTLTTDNASGYRGLQLPTYKGEPLPSPELAVVLPEDDEAVAWLPWEVFCVDLAKPIKDINNIHFLACYQAANTRVASDFLFWYYFSQSLKNILYKDQFIPALLAHEVKKKREFYRYWHIVSPQYESLLHQAVSQMPLACSLGYEPESLLRHFAEVCISDILDYALSRLPATFNDKVRGNLSLVLSSIQLNKPLALMTDALATKYCQWQHKLIGKATDTGLQLGFQLYEAKPSEPEQWLLAFFIGSQQDPSTKYALQDYWPPQSAQKALVKQQFGAHVEQQVLLQLALAAKIYPKLWDGMETSRPDSVCLSLDEAFEFLKESAWVLEDAGYKIVIPAWLTPKGRQRAKLRMRTAGKSPAKNTSATSYLSLDNLIDYQYELAMGEHSVSPEEWQQLVESKTPLVHFRGQWVELDRDKNARNVIALAATTAR
ncbi:SNF2 helicase-associated domain-containing protein [Methylocucumis oryzae]|uniref:SNF2 helicase-associated domain-containing protein n=1 Tax=Methylocucumis oryzae TaxID=1632867 RepID=UPI000A4563BD|nr:SNF2 helicase-associated domain-containing protein [Methylocucumis oryzae]